MNYWKEACGENKSREFIKGVIAGVKAFAVWKDGKELVGIRQVPFEKEVAEIKFELGWKPEWDKEKI